MSDVMLCRWWGNSLLVHRNWFRFSSINTEPLLHKRLKSKSNFCVCLERKKQTWTETEQKSNSVWLLVWKQNVKTTTPTHKTQKVHNLRGDRGAKSQMKPHSFFFTLLSHISLLIFHPLLLILRIWNPQTKMLKHTENELKLPQSFQTFSQKAPLNTCLFKFVFSFPPIRGRCRLWRLYWRWLWLKRQTGSSTKQEVGSSAGRAWAACTETVLPMVWPWPFDLCHPPATCHPPSF